MKPSSIKRNAILNVIRTVVAVIFPIITYPYAARVVGVVNIGKVNYIASIVTYFTIFAMFGIDTYGVRECAAVRDDRDRASTLASRLWSYSLITTFIALIGLGLMSFIYVPLHSYLPVILIQSLSVIFTTVGADWINVVYEDYTYTTIRGIAINVFNLIVLFTCVHTPEDYLIYAFLTISWIVIAGVLNVVHIRKFVTLLPVRVDDIRQLTRALLPFVVNNLSVAIYVGMDMTILGFMHGDYRVGIYSSAVKIYTMVKTVFIAVFSVTLARLSAHFKNGQREEFRRLISGLISVFTILAFPAMLGLILYADPIILIIAGPEYAEASTSLRLLAVALVFAAFGGIATRCANVPMGYEKLNTRATITAALENTLLNLPMIWVFCEIGAAITTILAELTVLMMCLVNFRCEHINWKSAIVWRDVRDTVFGLIGIGAVYACVNLIAPADLIAAIAGMVLSVPVYFGIFILMKNEIVTDGIRKIVSRLKKRA
ncbi:MAG: flippase [Lachnospiraceae bacterium]|nr:flippase [Lachnospiraceae bacterium]